MEKSKSKRKMSDRLSSLPDSVLCHILSFLPTKLSVSTSILARRYRFLWANVLNFDFEYCKNHVTKPGGMSFTDTISRVMLLSNVRELNRFRLILQDGEFREKHLFESWIRTAMVRNVQALEIELFYQNYLPFCLFTSKTLVDMTLHRCGCVPDAVNFPNLKRLHLNCVRYGSDEKFQDLISGCPVLEELNIQKICKSDLESCIISSSTIKRLTLNLSFSPDFGYDVPLLDYKLEINTPALRYLDVEDHISCHISSEVFNSLVEANISLDNAKVQDGDDDYFNSVFELVENICQVKCLKFDYQAYVDVSGITPSRFFNLTRLELAAHWSFLLIFLENADNLQVLILRELDKSDGELLKYWMEPQQVPTSLSSHLRKVTLQEFQNLDNEFAMISYILKHGKVLNKMDIYACCDDEIEYENDALRKITEFERGSPTCKVKFI